MAGAGLSRVPTHGTVFTRIQNLMRAGVIKERDRPLWYDVMVAFPPKDSDSHTGIDHGPLVREILYPEDKIRAQFYKVYGTATALNMARHSSVSNTMCARFIAKYQELEKDFEKSDVEIFEATAEELAKEGFHLKKKGDKQRSGLKQLSSTEVVSQTLASMFQKSLAQDMDQDKTQTTLGNEENK